MVSNHNLYCYLIWEEDLYAYTGRVADAQQAYWFSMKDFVKNNVEFSRYFMEISTEDELNALI